MEATQTNKWGATKKFIFKPKWARWKLHLQITNDKWRTYFSYDYHNHYINNLKTKAYRERLALHDMIVRIREKYPTGYKYANVFGNFTNDLDTDKKFYDHLVFSMTPEKCTWKQNLFFYETPIIGSAYFNVRLNCAETLKHWKDAQTQREIITEAQARAEVFKILNKSTLTDSPQSTNERRVDTYLHSNKQTP